MRAHAASILRRAPTSSWGKSIAASGSRTRRTIISRANTDIRARTRLQTARAAVSVEASSLRYVSYIMGGPEDSMLRGWDDCVLVTDEDGT